MNTKSGKGYALAMAIIFVIILTAAGLGLYYSVEHLTGEIRIQETGYARGYYAAIAGLRYASILLRNPDDLTFVANVYTVNGTELLPVGSPPAIGFFHDIGVDPADLAITIRRIVRWGKPTGKYKVSAAYTY